MAKVYTKLTRFTLLLQAQRMFMSNGVVSAPRYHHASIASPGYPFMQATSSQRRIGQRFYCTHDQRDLTPLQVKTLLEEKSIYLIDVREPAELTEEGKINGSINVPLGQLVEALSIHDEDFAIRYGVAQPDKENTNLVFYCKGGVRSNHAMKTAISLGYNRARHLAGGIDQWKKMP